MQGFGFTRQNRPNILLKFQKPSVIFIKLRRLFYFRKAFHIWQSVFGRLSVNSMS